jgi:uncharacterized membrane protein (DUF485 family)
MDLRYLIPSEERRRDISRTRQIAFAALALLLLAAIGAWRWHQTKDLALPPWVDGVHHTLLVRILLEQGRIPDTWAPQLPDVPLYYHFGFHVTAALLARLLGWTGTRLGDAMLLANLLWQVAAAAGVGVLVWSFSRDRRASVIAAALTGFVSQMPAFYVAWGRYTLLAGVTILIWGMVAAAAQRHIAVAVAIAATGVTHYFAFCLLIGFCGLLLLCTPTRRARVGLAAAVGVGICIAAPWLLRVAHWTAAFQRSHGSSRVGGQFVAPATSTLRLLGPLHNYALLSVAVVGLLIVLRRLRRDPATRPPAQVAFVLWSVCLALLLGPWQIGPLRVEYAAIVLFVPAVVFAAHALAQLRPWPVQLSAIAALVLWGLVATADLVPEETIIATSADRRAIEWIEVHTRSDALFLIDVVPWMGIWRGADGGWWIAPLTGRATVLPALAYSWGPPELMDLVKATAQRVYQLGELHGAAYCGELERLLDETDAGYYYTRSGLPTSCPEMSVLYDKDGVRLYALANSPAVQAAGSGSAAPVAPQR